jgi:N,N'-diacetylchitobiose transport system substrate-binding protein
MKKHIIAAICLCFVGALAATAGAATARQQAGGTLTVWLQVDAQTGWPAVVAAANQQFQSDHPGWTVNVQYQTWGSHLQNLDAALAAGAGGGGPDVVEMGNTEMTKYMAAGAFDNLGTYKSTFDNSANWLAGLTKSVTYGGKLFGVPYYAGSRVVTYRTDLFKKAGITALPTSLAQFTADAAKLTAGNKTAGFSPVYIAGTDWYSAMGFVYDYGGSIARTHAGKWYGNLTSPKSMAGLTAYKNFFAAASKASPTTDETHPNPYDVYNQGLAAAMIGPAWFAGSVSAKYKADTAQFVMPSHMAGQPMPGFLGGSDLAIPATSSNEALAADWIKDYTSTQNEQALQAAGNIPNATNLLAKTVNARAAAQSWFVPQAAHWVDVENANILRNMLAQILTGQLTVKQAALAADQNIASILNETS